MTYEPLKPNKININDTVRDAVNVLIDAHEKWHEEMGKIGRADKVSNEGTVIRDLYAYMYIRYSPLSKVFERAKENLRHAVLEANPTLFEPTGSDRFYMPKHVMQARLAPVLNHVVAEVAGNRIKKIPDMFPTPDTGRVPESTRARPQSI